MQTLQASNKFPIKEDPIDAEAVLFTASTLYCVIRPEVSYFGMECAIK